MSTICIACLDDKKTLHSLLEKPADSFQNIYDMLNFCIPKLRMPFKDKDTYICEECLIELINCVTFIEKCIQSYDIFSSLGTCKSNKSSGSQLLINDLIYMDLSLTQVLNKCTKNKRIGLDLDLPKLSNIRDAKVVTEKLKNSVSLLTNSTTKETGSVRYDLNNLSNVFKMELDSDDEQAPENMTEVDAINEDFDIEFNCEIDFDEHGNITEIINETEPDVTVREDMDESESLVTVTCETEPCGNVIEQTENVTKFTKIIDEATEPDCGPTNVLHRPEPNENVTNVRVKTERGGNVTDDVYKSDPKSNNTEVIAETKHHDNGVDVIDINLEVKVKGDKTQIDDKTERHDSITEVIMDEIKSDKIVEIIEDDINFKEHIDEQEPEGNIIEIIEETELDGATEEFVIEVEEEAVEKVKRKPNNQNEYHKCSVQKRCVRTMCLECNSSYCISKKHKCKFVCVKCDFEFNAREAMQNHIKSNMDEEDCRVACEHCPLLIPIKQLAQHKKAHPTLACAICDKLFGTRKSLQSHIMTHSARIYKCSQCDLRFKTKNTLKGHEEHSHAREEWKYLCDLCAKRFYTNSKLQHHKRRVHEKAKLGICQTCGKSFASQKHADEHNKLVHQKLKQYCCEWCGVVFGRKDNWRRHFKMCRVRVSMECEEVTEKTIECVHCKKMFRTQEDLKRHVKFIHIERQFKCSKCDLRFTNKVTLMKHIESHTKSNLKFKCNSCYRGFEDVRELEIHMIRHKMPYECDLCDEKFSQKFLLSNHKISAHNVQDSLAQDYKMILDEAIQHAESQTASKQ